MLNMSIFYTSGNAMLGFWILYILLFLYRKGIKSRFLKYIGIDHDFNRNDLSEKEMKVLENGYMSMLPIYSYIFLELALWIWTLMLFSENVPSDDSFFYYKPKTSL